MHQQPKFAILLVLAAILIGNANCQSSDGSDGLWSRMKSMVREFVDSMKKIWNDMKEEIRSRTSDMGSWTREVFDSFKNTMNDWINDVGGASEKEKEDMRKYIERLEMPKDSEK